MTNKIPSATCANCPAIIHEGERALYDDTIDNYFCGEDCFDDWYNDNLARYKRQFITEVDM